MAGLSLKAFLKNWYQSHHFYMMPGAVRAQWTDAMSEDDFDVVTEETQETFRDLMNAATAIAPPAYDKDITIHAGNIERLRGIYGLPDFDTRYSIGDKYNYTISDAVSRDEYLRVFSPKLGDRFYYNDVRSGGQKPWGDKKSGLLLDRPYPDINTMSDAEIRRFYTIVRTTLRNISDNAPEFPDPDNPPKVANFLGTGKAFEEFTITPDGFADRKLKEFAKLAAADPILMEILRNNLSSRFGADYTVDTFIADLLEEKIRARALNRAPAMMTVLKEWNSPYSTIDPSIKTKTMRVFGNSDDMDNVIHETNQETETINDIKLAQFKNPRIFAELLGAMYDTSKEGKKSAFFNEFELRGGEEITKPMTTVVNHFNYDKMDGKYKDKLNFSQKLRKDIGDFTDDHITKFWKRNLRHNYIELNAKGVVDAICKLEISPEKGLKEILAKKAEIKKLIAQKSSASEKGFDFLVEVLEKIQGPMKKAFAGALKNGKQAEAVAQEIIKAALAHQPPKIAEAKVALETLAVMRYDTFSSARGKDVSKAIMGAKFLDGASFMKNEGIAFILNAAQKTFNLGLNGAFWAGVMGRNLIQNARGKISDADIVKLTEAMAKIQTNAEKFSTFESAEAELHVAQTNFDAFEAAHDAAITAAGFPTSDPKRLEKYINKLQDDLSLAQEEYDEKWGELDQNRPRTLAKYGNFKTEADMWLAAANATPPQVAPQLTPELGAELNLWATSLPQMYMGDGSLEHLMPMFRHYCVQMETGLGLTATQRSARLLNLLARNRSIEAQQTVLDSVRLPYAQVASELGVAKDIFAFQEKKRNERAESKTEHNPGDAPLNDAENAQTLAWFWNACNGYDFGLNINDYNPLKKHKNESQKLEFNRAANDRLGRAT